jgi:hypothetical protein
MSASLALDTRAGTHFATDKIYVTPHALDECTKDFGIERAKAPVFVMNRLRKASYISEVIGEDGNAARLFGHKRMAFVVSLTEPVVITVYPQDTIDTPVNEAVTKILTRSLRASERKVKTDTKRLGVQIAEWNVKRAELNLRIARTESRKTVADMSAMITDIDTEIRELERQSFEIRREHTRLARSLIAYI